jgi:signal transduction histidine kinase
MCLNRNKSFLSNREFNIENTSKEEAQIIRLLGMTNAYIIPLVYEGVPFGVFTFADNKYYQSNLDKLSKEQRKELESFIKLISPSIYQAIQKGKIEKTLLDLQTTQTQLIEAERMASLGQLVGGVAHEINNPISIIRSNSELITSSLNSMLKDVPHFLETLSEAEKEIFYTIVYSPLNNKEFLTTTEERVRKKDIKKELEVLVDSPEKIDYITEQILILRLKSPYLDYINILGLPKFIESLTIAQIFVNQSNSIGNIEIAVEKATRVVFALRNYLNTEMFYEKKEVDLISEIEKALHLYDNYIIGKINIYKDFPKELYFTCTPETLSQVWKNLFFNAIQAMYLTEKKLEIRLERLDSLPEKVKSMKSSLVMEEDQTHTLHKSWIVFSITDSGEGIIPKNQDKIFTPFYTTKALGEGIGLGLYVSRKIVHDHGGRIYFESEEGRTEFLVALPII